MFKKILGLDLGTNSIGWALLEEDNGKPFRIIDLGCRIFTKAVEEKTPTPKNMKRRNARLARRVIQRRARRKKRMLNYLVKLELLPKELQEHSQPEVILNDIGDPYVLRSRGLNKDLTKHELGRVILHLVQRRGFLSSRKTLLGDMVDDPDVQAELAELEASGDETISSEQAKEENAFKKDISELRDRIKNAGCRTLGEYLASFGPHGAKRNRQRLGGHLRTDRQMYKEELDLIWARQSQCHPFLTDEIKEQVEKIIFFQRPLRLRSDRVGKCSLEPRCQRAQLAKLECQRFRYLQDINNLQYFDLGTDTWQPLNDGERGKLIYFFENHASITFPGIRKVLELDRKTEFNLESDTKKLKGNITACEIRKALPAFDSLSIDQQHALVEDLLTIRKKSVLKNRLLNHWRFSTTESVKLCLLELEPGHGSHSLKAIRKMLPFLEQGQIYSDARQSADYSYNPDKVNPADRLGAPPEIPNPIVLKALHELRRLVNAIIAEYGKPDTIRIEMARDLEMNTKRFKEFMKQQAANTRANDEAAEKYKEMAGKNPHLKLSSYPTRDDKIKYRLWKDQEERCIYSGRQISLSNLFSPEIDVDHILPYSKSLDDSYMNKVVCYAAENRYKGQRSPVEAFGGSDKWTQIIQSVRRWPKQLRSKTNRFFVTEEELQQRDFINSQLNDTRYISRLAREYLLQLGTDITVSKGITTSWLRNMWNLNSLLGNSQVKERTDHRHHAIDAVVIACIDRSFYKTLVDMSKWAERRNPEFRMRDIHFDPPWQNLRGDLAQILGRTIIAHSPQRKLSGALHEETGVGFIPGIGNVNRVNLDRDFKMTKVKRIVDENVRKLIEEHLSRYGNNPKEAFAEGITLYHKDGKTPIRRVRIVQSKTTLNKLEVSKHGVKDSRGNIFKWLAYGNIHHVEILRDRGNDTYHGVFVTAMEASCRVRGINMPKQPIIRTDHGDGLEFIMALHINDLVRLKNGGTNDIYRIQKLDSANKRLELRLHAAATINNEVETLPDRESTIPALMNAEMVKLRVNCLGKIIQ